MRGRGKGIRSDEVVSGESCMLVEWTGDVPYSTCIYMTCGVSRQGLLSSLDVCWRVHIAIAERRLILYESWDNLTC